MPIDLQVLLDDYNGSAMAVAGHAEWGFIPEEWFLAYPVGFGLPANYVIGTTPFANDDERKAFLKANYRQVRNVAGSNETALFVALLRLHVATQGTLVSTVNARSVVEDEYVAVNHQGADWNDPLNDIPDTPTFHNVAKFIKHHGNTLVHQMIYLFSARGHHWDPQYNELYERLKKACFISGDLGFQLPSNEVIYRLAIHAFGVKSLLDLTMADRNTGRMAAAMVLRFTPSAPIAGVAHITTLNAALNTMRQEAWWEVFEAKFHEEITKIRDEVNTIHRAPYTYHVAAKVFGHNQRTMVSQQSLDAFNRLSQFVLGYIDHLGRRHSLAGQQAVTQKSGGPRGMAEAFSKACDKFTKPSTDVDSMAAFLASV
jgi:uncharacterized membrane protein YfbV (UPF0208 family)